MSAEAPPTGPARTYPAGVTCWIDTEQPDPAAASRFYGELFGWTFTNAMPPQAESVYLIAQLDGNDVGAIGPAPAGTPVAWNTYIAVAEADGAALAVATAGGTVVSGPNDAGPGGRTATCADPQGAEFRLWQPYRRLGAQTVNLPGSWNFSDLRTADIAAARTFYSEIFGWEYLNLGDSVETMVSVPGYGDHLAATVDPDIYRRQAGAPAGFADVIGAIEDVGAAAAGWHVKFSVADRDASAALAVRLGATVLETAESPWAALARIRDPQGAEFTLSEFRPPA
ncbi:VOC family protein [Cryobacterium frigoriphilum]|uniref:VOC family protein n=1 Tax=Cryobacterium frigoriphilum TaxID=1259150 RepID=A0A4R8ZU47_9MICO|nr:VOC family protein [Cryobacterium frigoriphilum]TFD45610.1 VOC family protein [Cryobacterium frigoriphilum]